MTAAAYETNPNGKKDGTGYVFACLEMRRAVAQPHQRSHNVRRTSFNARRCTAQAGMYGLPKVREDFALPDEPLTAECYAPERGWGSFMVDRCWCCVVGGPRLLQALGHRHQRLQLTADIQGCNEGLGITCACTSRLGREI